MAITTSTSVKLLAGWSDVTTYDSRISDLISRVTTFLEKWLGRVIEQVSVVEHPVAYGTQTFRLRNTPVTFSGLTSIYYDTSANFGRGASDFAAATLLTEGTDYVLEVDQADGVTSLGGSVRRINNVWASRIVRDRGRLSAYTEPRRGHIKVTYTGGWSTVPGDISLAANMLIIRAIQMGPQGVALLSESYAGYSWSAGSAQSPGNMLMTPEIITLLMPYKRLSA